MQSHVFLLVHVYLVISVHNLFNALHDMITAYMLVVVLCCYMVVLHVIWSLPIHMSASVFIWQCSTPFDYCPFCSLAIYARIGLLCQKPLSSLISAYPLCRLFAKPTYVLSCSISVPSVHVDVFGLFMPDPAHSVAVSLVCQYLCIVGLHEFPSDHIYVDVLSMFTPCQYRHEFVHCLYA